MSWVPAKGALEDAINALQACTGFGQGVPSFAVGERLLSFNCVFAFIADPRTHHQES
jgi:hypothetical protein